MSIRKSAFFLSFVNCFFYSKHLFQKHEAYLGNLCYKSFLTCSCTSEGSKTLPHLHYKAKAPSLEYTKVCFLPFFSLFLLSKYLPGLGSTDRAASFVNCFFYSSLQNKKEAIYPSHTDSRELSCNDIFWG